MYRKIAASWLVLFAISSAYADCPQSLVNKAMKYLTTLDNVIMIFSQSDQNDASYSGAFMLKKPRFRINYDPPHPLVITGNQSSIKMYDYELNELSILPARENTFRFLLANDKQKWSDQFEVSQCIQVADRS